MENKLSDANQYEILYQNEMLRNDILDSYEDGLILEEKLREMKSSKYESEYDIVGEIPYNDLSKLIQLMREDVCDNQGTFPSFAPSDAMMPIIRYKNREYGDLVRRYNLTCRGFLMNLMVWWDGD